MTPLRIAVACFPTLGGSGIVATEVGTRLAARGHEIRFFATEPPPRLDTSRDRISFQRVIATAKPPVDSCAQALSLAAALVEAARDGIDVIHAHYAIPHAASAALARTILRQKGAKVPRLVTTLHGTDVTELALDPAFRSVVQHAVLDSDAITVPSEWLRERVEENLAVDERGVNVIPNFVDVAVYRPREGDLRHLFPEIPGWDDGATRPRVLFHGSSFRPLKRVGDAVRALAILRQHREAVLVLVGDGPERARVEALSRELGQADHVRFLGAMPRFEGLLSCADLFLLPSATESFGLAALEALASGVPVVASSVGGVREVVRDGVTGLLVPPEQPAAVAAAARSLLENEPRRLAMAQSARADAIARFAPDPAVDRYEQVLRGS
jgi:N-acetyl-alpha-D-glucosaminyl L-malate synthase BshA